MLNNFIYAKEKSLFEEALNNGVVLDEAIVFIEDTKEIWNHGTYFGSTDISELESSVQYILNNKADKSEIPTKFTDLEQDIPYVTIAQLDKKQDIIEDLETIKTNAELGANAVNTMVTKDDLTNTLNGYATTDLLESKQNVIEDLAAIRNGAELGASALLQGALTGLLTETAASNTYVTKEHFGTLEANVTKINGDYITESKLTSSLDGYVTLDKHNDDLNNKVDKDGDKGLSTNDFTDDDKENLNSLKNDYSEIIGEIDTLKTDTAPAISLASFMNGYNPVTSLTNIPITKRLVIATVSSSASLSLVNTPLSAGREIHVIVKNSSSSAITITIPNSGNYINTMSSNAMPINGNSYGEINLISDGSNVYIKYN